MEEHIRKGIQTYAGCTANQQLYTGIDVADVKKQWQLEAKIANMSGVGKPML